MREVNFFSPYISTKKPVKVGQVQVILAIVFLLLVCGSYYSWNMISIVRYSLKIAEHNAFLTNPANVEALKKYNETKQKLDIITQYETGFAAIENGLKARGIIGSELIKKLNTAIPHELYLKNFNITDSSVSINGIGTSRNAIAEYERNLIKLGLFKEVFVSTIASEKEGSSSFTFSANCMFKEGVTNEAK